MGRRIRSFQFGRPIHADEAEGWEWKYDDDGTPIKDQVDHACGLCGKKPTDDGHDPCIANLPGVASACCGHGVGEGYVKFDNGLVLRGGFDHVEAHKREKAAAE